jgi:hypothetical protein
MITVVKQRFTLMEDMLATKASDPEIHAKFTASLAPDAETREQEIAEHGPDAVFEKSICVFHYSQEPETSGKPIIYDYQVKGFFKEACSSLTKMGKDEFQSGRIRNFKKVITQMIFPGPRHIVLMPPENRKEDPNIVDIFSRPLRAQTPKGEVSSLVSSERVPKGTWFDVETEILGKTFDADDYVIDMLDLVQEFLWFGKYMGLGQWRSGGWGRFSVSEPVMTEKVGRVMSALAMAGKKEKKTPEEKEKEKAEKAAAKAAEKAAKKASKFGCIECF